MSEGKDVWAYLFGHHELDAVLKLVVSVNSARGQSAREPFSYIATLMADYN